MNRFQKIAVYSLALCGILSPEIILLLNIILLVVYASINKSFRIDKRFIIFILLVITHAVLNVLISNDTLIQAFKQIVGISISFVFYSTIFDKKTNVTECFLEYYKVALFLSIFIYIQHIAVILKLPALYNYGWISPRLTPYFSGSLLRAAGLMNEPASYCMILSPAMFVSVYSLLTKERRLVTVPKALFVLVAYILTFSSIGYIGVILSIILVALSGKRITVKKLLIPIVATIVFVLIYINIPEFSKRVNDTLFLMSRKTTYGDVNISSSTFLLHLRMSVRIFLGTYGLGGGIGSYSTMFKRFFNPEDGVGILWILNTDDANSLLFRILAELGVVGICGVVFFIAKYYLPTIHNDSNQAFILSIIGKGILVFFLLKLLRSGHYFYNGMFFFTVMYIRAYFIAKSKDLKTEASVKIEHSPE